MRPYFFGSPEKQLLGVHHTPQRKRQNGSGIVLCYPLGHEYVNVHRTFRVLAARLARAGFHVLRFDYYGTGDSAGDGHEGTLRQWTQDAGAALDELKDSHDVKRLTAVGVRLGATIAAFATAHRVDVDRIVLWEPIVDGRAYVEGIKRRHGLWLEAELEDRRAASQQVGEEEVLGYPVTKALINELQGVTPEKLPIPTHKHVLLILEEDERDASVESLQADWNQGGVRIDLKRAQRTQVWGSEVGLSLASVPNDALSLITEWLVETGS